MLFNETYNITRIKLYFILAHDFFIGHSSSFLRLYYSGFPIFKGGIYISCFFLRAYFDEFFNTSSFEGNASKVYYRITD
ncbi:hypothetical protein UNH65_04370 [Chitinophaga sp. 180180018-2]|nr:hypothetical protein [Chitinophaga sp. 212800010-3]